MRVQHFFKNLLFVLFFFCFGVLRVSAEGQAIVALREQGFASVASLSLGSGMLHILETVPPAGSNSLGGRMAILFDGMPSPHCQVERISNPSRVLVSCDGNLIRNLKPLALSKSKIAKQLRFGSTPKVSKFVFDLLEKLPEEVATEEVLGSVVIFLNMQLIIPPTATPLPTVAPTETPSTSLTPAENRLLEITPDATIAVVTPARGLEATTTPSVESLSALSTAVPLASAPE